MNQLAKILLLLSIGLLIGAGLGLYVGWVAWPTQYSDANPATLQEGYQIEYVKMVADVYANDGDLTTALVRLGEFGPEYETVLLNAINTQLLQNGDPNGLRRLARLAKDAGVTSPVIESILADGGAP